MSKVHLIKCGTENCYIVSNDNAAVLVDTGTKEYLDTVIAECGKYDIKLIVLTHTHFDHADNAAALSERFGVPVAYNRADDELFENYNAQPLKCYGLTGRVVLGMSKKVLAETKVDRPENVVFIKDGDSLSEYGIDADIIGLPGHTSGSIGVDVEGKALLVGDALDNWVLPGMGHLYSDLDAMKKTYEKIRSLGERTIFYGHGKPTVTKVR
ncbi:MAG: MBL fold metallo-hydrolase [Oscillospiraceae bacterium]|nr:MBL fold metallo-hydrolase [Oscillospiraceae bacterium]